MERKIVKQGTSTMTISLPSNWVKKFSLDDKDVVHITEIDNNLILSTQKVISSKELNIDLRGKSNSLVIRKLLGLYQEGADKINITHDNQKDIIEQITNQMIGFVVMNQSENHILIEDISGISDIDFNSIYKRCFQILIEQYDTLQHKIQNDENLEDLDKIDYNLNKFTDFALRYLSKRGHENFKKTPSYYHIISQIELLGDIMTRISSVYNKKDKDELLELITQIRQLLKELFKFSKNSLSENKNDIVMKSKELENKYYSPDSSKSTLLLIQCVSIVKDLFNTVLVLKEQF